MNVDAIFVLELSVIEAFVKGFGNSSEDGGVHRCGVGGHGGRFEEGMEGREKRVDLCGGRGDGPEGVGEPGKTCKEGGKEERFQKICGSWRDSTDGHDDNDSEGKRGTIDYRLHISRWKRKKTYTRSRL